MSARAGHTYFIFLFTIIFASIIPSADAFSTIWHYPDRNFEMEPGTTKELVWSIRGETTQTVKVFGDGDMAQYIIPSQDKVQLHPDDIITIPFEVMIPADYVGLDTIRGEICAKAMAPENAEGAYLVKNMCNWMILTIHSQSCKNTELIPYERQADGKVYCLYPETAAKLAERGWDLVPAYISQ